MLEVKKFLFLSSSSSSFIYIYIYYYSEERTIILVQCCETYWSYITSGNSRRQVYGSTLTRVKIICAVCPEYLKVV